MTLYESFYDEFDDGSIGPNYNAYRLDANGWSESGSALYFDFATDKTTRVNWEKNDYSNARVRIEAEIKHTSTGTDEGRPQNGFGFVNSNNDYVGLTATHDLDRLNYEEIASDGTVNTSNTLIDGSWTYNPFWVRIDWYPSSNDIECYTATSDPVNGSGSWTLQHTTTPSYTPTYPTYYGDDGDGETDWFRVLEELVPTKPTNATQTINDDDDIDVTWDDSDRENNYRVHINRDSTGYSSPSGGPTTPGENTTSANYNPSSDTAYDRQVGADSSFRFRVRAENDNGSSDWSYTSTKHTTPVPPHAPSVNRPDSDTVDISWVNQSDIEDGVEIQYREDTGSGYGAWTALTTTAAGSTSYSATTSGALSADARYQFRLRTTAPDGAVSDWVYHDYGNNGNVYFSDDFEDQDLAEWDETSLGDADSGIASGSHADLGISGAEERTYYCRLDGGDYIQENLGDLSSESDVVVKTYAATGSMDSSSENTKIEWYDGSAWQTLRQFYWEYNRQGWAEVVALVPASYLSTDNRVRFRGYGGGGDHFAVDRVVISDVVHEYTTPAAPSSLSLDTTIEDELSASWSLNATFEDEVETDFGPTGGTLTETAHAAGTTSNTWTGLSDGEKYDVNVRSVAYQYRHGSKSTESDSQSLSGSDVTILPAPTSLSVDAIAADSFDVSWVDNHDYGDVDIEIKRSSASSWSTIDTVGRGNETYTYSGLLNGEEYNMRVLAATEHTRTEDA